MIYTFFCKIWHCIILGSNEINDLLFKSVEPKQNTFSIALWSERWRHHYLFYIAPIFFHNMYEKIWHLNYITFFTLIGMHRLAQVFYRVWKIKRKTWFWPPRVEIPIISSHSPRINCTHNYWFCAPV